MRQVVLYERVWYLYYGTTFLEFDSPELALDRAKQELSSSTGRTRVTIGYSDKKKKND